MTKVPKHQQEVKKTKKKQLLVIALTAILLLSFMSIIAIQPAAAVDLDYDSIVEYYGKDWYFWDCDSDHLAILLFGGYGNPTSITTNPLTLQAEADFASELHGKGLDVISPAESLVYSTSNNMWLTYIAALYKYYNVYDYIYLFGHSAGGLIVGAEIQKSGVGSVYDAAVMASAPVDYSSGYFNTADTADDAVVRTAFICHENDSICGDICPQMEAYYDNMVVDKEWHLNWGAEGETSWDAHDVFPDTCLDHYEETITDAVYNWFLDPDISLTVYAMDGMGRPLYLSLYIDDEYVGTTWNTYQVKHGFHTIEVPDYSGFTFFACYEYDGSYHYNNPDNISITSAKNVMAWYY